jgi:hypothetical protein
MNPIPQHPPMDALAQFHVAEPRAAPEDGSKNKLVWGDSTLGYHLRERTHSIPVPASARTGRDDRRPRRRGPHRSFVKHPPCIVEVLASDAFAQKGDALAGYQKECSFW